MARKRNKRRGRRHFGVIYKMLSLLVICGAIIAAMTLFFRVNTVVITGQQHYSEEEVLAATGIRTGDNLFLLNKYSVAGRIVEQLPYVEELRIKRKLPDTILVELKECGRTMVIVQDDATWFISPSGKIVEQKSASAVGSFGVISGCKLLEPAVGQKIVFSEEDALRQSSLLELLAALESADALKEVNGIRMDDLSSLSMDYMGRFTVRMPYNADYPYKLRMLKAALNSGKIQENMTGTFIMLQEDGQTNFVQNLR